ncbi:MAG: hypothetical protein ACRBBP_03575 [Bdellovibrionales bacterium]
MENQLECRALRRIDIDLVQSFIESTLDGSEDIFLLWKSSFREESLKIYLEEQWCFGCFKEESLVGVVLQKPLLFWSGLTQVLWVEDLKASSLEAEAVLLETSYKTSREKHLQALAFSEAREWSGLLEKLGLKKEVGQHRLMVKTAKWS